MKRRPNPERSAGSKGKLGELYLLKITGRATPEQLAEYERLLDAEAGDEEDTDEETPAPGNPRKTSGTRSRTAYVTSLDDLAVAVGINLRNLKTWRARPGFPKKSAKGYSIAAVKRFIETNRNSNNTRETTPEEKEERVKMLQARRMLLELKLEQESGRLVPAAAAAETVAAIYERQFSFIRRLLGSEAQKIAKLGTVEEINEHLRGMFNDMLADSRMFLEQRNAALQNELRRSDPH